MPKTIQKSSLQLSTEQFSQLYHACCVITNEYTPKHQQKIKWYGVFGLICWIASAAIFVLQPALNVYTASALIFLLLAPMIWVTFYYWFGLSAKLDDPAIVDLTNVILHLNVMPQKAVEQFKRATHIRTNYYQRDIRNKELSEEEMSNRLLKKSRISYYSIRQTVHVYPKSGNILIQYRGKSWNNILIKGPACVLSN